MQPNPACQALIWTASAALSRKLADGGVVSRGLSVPQLLCRFRLRVAACPGWAELYLLPLMRLHGLLQAAEAIVQLHDLWSQAMPWR